MHIVKKPDDNATVRRLIDQLNSRLAILESGDKYELETILGPDYWADEEDSNLALGHHFSKLVRDGRAPFVYEGLTGDRHNQYRYNP
jgi:hypothetical protein